MKCSKLRRFWGSAPDPAAGAYDAPPDPLVGRGFLPLATAASRLRRLQFPQLTCLYMYVKNSHISCPESTPSTPTNNASMFFTSNMSHHLKSLKICPDCKSITSLLIYLPLGASIKDVPTRGDRGSPQWGHMGTGGRGVKVNKDDPFKY